MRELGTLGDTSSSDPGLSSPAPSDILKDVVAYVEVRTANDNRSAAVKRVLERMGARVQEKFSDDVTHVVFKEGKKRTKDKAQKLGVHLVSVLWVDSCKEKQERVPECNFSANTEHCGTPPPGVRWKKYKSMQPRDFEDEVARSADRCQKRRRRVETHRLLLQGMDSATPFHSRAHVLVVDTQPHSPFAAIALQSPVIIPNTPPSMQARLDQLMREKEARRQEESEVSPVCRNTGQDVPLQRTLFKSTPPAQEKEMDNKSKCKRRSARLSGLIGRDAVADVIEEKGSSQCTTQTKTPTSSQSKSQNKPTTPKRAMETKPSSSSESAESDSGDKGRPRAKSNPESFNHLNKTQTKTSGVMRISTRQSFGSSLPQTVNENSSQPYVQLLQNLQQNDEMDKNSRVCTRHSSGSFLPKAVRRIASQEVLNMHAELGQGAHNGMGGEKSSFSGDETNSTQRKQKRKQGASSTRQKSRKGERTPETENGNGTGHSASFEQPSQAQQVEAGISKTATANVTTTTKKRKLLNPSQELHILSVSPSDNENLPKSTSGCVEPEKRGKKRKSCDVDAIFPGSLPASKRGCRSLQSKENQGMRRLLSQVDPNTSEDSLTESCSNRKEQRSTKSRKASQLTRKDQSVTASALCSTSQTSSVLGSSMSMLFSDTSSSAPLGRRLAPPRNSMADFQVQKPSRKRKLAVPKEGRNKGSEQIKPMSLQKFRLTCMPSLVMTSLHRPEQELIISAVKKLGVFRIEDKVSKDTTHVVYGEARRTLNVLHAMARGCWLISKEWVLHSVEEGQWVSEADYEAAEDFPKAKEARLAREAEALGSYQCRIFETAGSMFVSNSCTPPRAQLLKLLHLCGAKVTDCIQRADFYIGDQSHDDKNSIKPIWVLDCISQQELLPMDNYILAINFKAKSSSSPEF